MKPYVLTIALAALLSQQALAADNCASLIQYGLRDEIQSTASANNYHESVNQLCKDYSSFKADKRSGSVKASYGAFKGSAGYSAEKYESVSEALCSADTNISKLDSNSTLTNKLLNPDALAALKHCETLNASGLKLTTNIPDAAETVTISFQLSPIPGTDIVQKIKVGKLQTDDSIVCQEPSPPLTDGELPALKSVTYTCSRKIKDTPFDYLGKRLYAKAGIITIPTSTAPITISVPAIYAEQPTPTNLELRINALGDQSSPVGTVISSVLSPHELNKLSPNLQKYWVLADGAMVDRESKYFQIKTDGSLNNVRLPDLRGLFLRGLNLGRNDDKRDPDGVGRVAGDFQVDTIAKHDHGGGMARHGLNNGGRDQTDNHWNPRNTPPVSYGSAETRPKNSSVYYYIRIN